MEKVLIESYRGYDIFFNTRDEKFFVEIGIDDKTIDKPSFASIKKYIDDFIKNNNEFKSFKLQRFGSMFHGDSIINVIGIRKDGLLVYEKNGKKEILSSYSEGEYFEYIEENTVILEKIKALENQKEHINSLIKEESKNLIRVKASEVKKRYIK